MRDKNVLLKSFDEIKTLQQYLYMDESHTVTMKNKLGVSIQIRMTESLQYLGKNLNFPNVPEMNFDGEMNLKVFTELIQQLKEQPAEIYPNRFNNRWDEISKLTATNLAATAGV